MSDLHEDDLGAEGAFIASSFVGFHTEEPASPGDWIPMTKEEASERWESWTTEHDRQVAERAWDACVASMKYEDGTPVEIVASVNPYRKEQ